MFVNKYVSKPETKTITVKKPGKSDLKMAIAVLEKEMNKELEYHEAFSKIRKIVFDQYYVKHN